MPPDAHLRQDHIACFGGAHMDRTTRFSGKINWGDSNPVGVIKTPGGVARNVASSLGRLGRSVVMVSATGTDSEGDRIINGLEGDGIDASGVFRLEDYGTASYTAILDKTGDLVIGLADMEIYQTITPERIEALPRGVLDCGLWAVDSNLPDQAIHKLAEISGSRRLIAFAASTVKASRLSGIFDKIDVLFANRHEAATLSDHPIDTPEDALGAGDRLRQSGIGTILITLGKDGACLIGDGIKIHSPPPAANAGDVNGAGDAFAAGAIDALIENAPPEQVLRRAIALASLAMEATGAAITGLDRALLEQRIEEMETSA